LLAYSALKRKKKIARPQEGFHHAQQTLRRTLFAATAIAAASIAGSAFAAKVAVITPYLAQPGTQFYVEAFQDVAKQKGWDVNVIDTQSDVAR